MHLYVLCHFISRLLISLPNCPDLQPNDIRRAARPCAALRATPETGHPRERAPTVFFNKPLILDPPSWNIEANQSAWQKKLNLPLCGCDHKLPRRKMPRVVPSTHFAPQTSQL